MTHVVRLAAGSVVIAAAVLALKLAAWWVTGSVALLADGLESVVNVAAAGAALVAVHYSALPADANHPYGHTKAKLSLDFISGLAKKKDGKLILVTAINPTPAGEGKTTTTVGLGDGLNRIGKKAMICLRDPSLGPCFGMKGGAAGGGYAQIVPMEDINLHFTGDFHAITSAHNLLSALIDNHIYWGNELGIDIRRVAWRRVMDMNDRALREIVCSLGGVANGFPREGGFDIVELNVQSKYGLRTCFAAGSEIGSRKPTGRSRKCSDDSKSYRLHSRLSACSRCQPRLKG